MSTTVEDRDAILQLLYRYNHTLDFGAPDAWAALFTEDGVFDVAGSPVEGRQALTAWASNVNGVTHVVSNPIVTVDADSAAVQAYIVAYQGTTVITVGTYDDHLVRTADGWRFKKRVFVPRT